MSVTKSSKSAKAKPASSVAKAKSAAKPVVKKATKAAAKSVTPKILKAAGKADVKPKAQTAKKELAKVSKPKKASASVAKVITPAPVIESSAEIQVVISNESIATRAYYISERRQAMGWPGDSETDWLEALNQLTAEAKRRKP